MSYLILASASFVNVFLLALNSQFVRDRKIMVVWVLSWGISTGQFTYTYIVANAENPTMAFLASGVGSSLGVVCSILFYSWLREKTKLGKRIWKQE